MKSLATKTEYYLLQADNVNEAVLKIKPCENDGVRTLEIMRKVRKAFIRACEPTEIGDINQWQETSDFVISGEAIESGDGNAIEFTLTPISIY